MKLELKEMIKENPGNNNNLAIRLPIAPAHEKWIQIANVLNVVAIKYVKNITTHHLIPLISLVNKHGITDHANVEKTNNGK